MADTDSPTAPVAEATEQTPSGDRSLWGTAMFWAMHAWVLAYVGVLAGAFTIQFVEGEFPCPLCMLQRYGMILSTLGALWIILQARRNTLTWSTYAQGLGLGVLGAITGALVSTRQILLHIKPGDPGYGSAVMGLHLYSWALITFVIVVVFVGFALVLMPRGIPVAPVGGALRTVSTIVIVVFLAILAANVVAIVFLEGFAWVLPDDPTSYGLLDQLSGNPIPQG